MPEDVRTPYESEPVSAKPEPVERPFAWQKPVSGRMQSEKILSEIRKERGRMAKRLALSLTIILIASATGFFWRGAWTGSGSMWLAFAGFLFLIGLFPLFALVVRWPTLAVVTPLAVLAMFMPFLPFLHVTTAVAVISVSAIFFVWGGFSMRMRSQILTEFRLGDIMQAGIRTLMLGFATLYASAYYFAVIPQRVGVQKFFISEQTFSELVTVAASGARRVLPQFSPSMTIGDAATAVIELRREALLNELNKEPGFANLSASQKQAVEEQAIAESRREIINSLSSTIGRQIKANESVVSVLWGFITNAFGNLAPETQKIAQIVWGTGLWFIVVFFGTTLASLFVFVAWILLQLFLSFRFFEIVREPAERKVLNL